MDAFLSSHNLVDFSCRVTLKNRFRHSLVGSWFIPFGMVRFRISRKDAYMVLLIATYKTNWNNFLLLQFVLAVFGVEVSGYFIKQFVHHCAFCLIVLLYNKTLYEWIDGILRDSVTVSFYLFGTLDIDEGHKNVYIIRLLNIYVSRVCNYCDIHFYK